jgi:hypothetical protein
MITEPHLTNDPFNVAEFVKATWRVDCSIYTHYTFKEHFIYWNFMYNIQENSCIPNENQTEF